MNAELEARLHEVLRRERIWSDKNKARITELEAENDILRERLLERNNVHRRLVKMRSALEHEGLDDIQACDKYPMNGPRKSWCSEHRAYNCKVDEFVAKAREALEGESCRAGHPDDQVCPWCYEAPAEEGG